METNLCEGCREKDSSVMLRRNDLVMCDMCWGKPMSTEFVLDRSTLWLDDDCEIEKSDKTISENTPQNVIELEDNTEDSMIHFDTPFSNAAMLEFATSDVPDTDTPYGEILNTLEDPELPESTLSQDNNQAEEVTETSQNVDITTIPLISQDQSQEDDEKNGDEDEEKMATKVILSAVLVLRLIGIQFMIQILNSQIISYFSLTVCLNTLRNIRRPQGQRKNLNGTVI